MRPALLLLLAFDPDGFVPVSIIANNYSVLAVHPKVGPDSVSSLIALARANPDKLNYATLRRAAPPAQLPDQSRGRIAAVPMEAAP